MTDRILPPCASPEAFGNLRDSDFDAAIACLRQRHGLPAAPHARFPRGSCFSFDAGNLAYKFFAPIFPDDFDRERRSLEFLAGRLPVRTPEIAAAGFLDDWGYIVMARLPGEALEERWPAMDASGRQAACASAGAMMAALHALDVPEELDALNGPAGWSGFVDQRIAAAPERNRALGAPEELLEQLPDFLAQWSPALRRYPRRTFLHTEIGQPHLILAPGGTRITGLVDFEPSMVGNPGYEWPSIGLFLCPCDRAAFASFAEAYGESPLAGEILAWHMVHQFGSLRQLLQRAGPCITAPRLDDVAEQVFGLGPGR